MENSFNQWAFVELMGHNKIAGLVSEQAFGSQVMIRVDVPEIDGTPAFSKIYNVSAVYAITPVSEETAMEYAGRIQAKPLDVWDMQVIFDKRIKELIAKGEITIGKNIECSSLNILNNEDQF